MQRSMSPTPDKGVPGTGWGGGGFTLPDLFLKGHDTPSETFY